MFVIYDVSKAVNEVFDTWQMKKVYLLDMQEFLL